MFDDVRVKIEEHIINPIRFKIQSLFNRINAYRKRMGWKFWAIVAGVGFLLFIIFVLYTYISFANDLATPESLMNRNNTGLIITDRNGTTIYRAEGAHTTSFTELSNISPYVPQATIAIEDKDFYKHPGFSARSILLAVYADIQLGSARYGASTLTQQLVKNALLTPEKSLKRKLQELILSIEIERRYSKDQILEMYINSNYYGSGAYGITNAAQIYFNKRPANLDLAESAALAAILNAPSGLSPYGGDLEALNQRKDLVIDKMVEQGDITAQQATAGKAEKLDFAPPPKESFGGDAAHFALWLRDYLYQKYGEDAVTRLGFRVTSTLDYSLQQSAVKTLQTQVKALVSQKVSNGALVSMNPKTGEILAMVGSVDYENEQFGKVNVVFAKRQPGSSFKPIVYTEAFKQGFTAATILHDVPTDFAGYKPLDYDRKFRGDVTIRRSLANSLNVPAVELLQKVGIDNAIALAQNMGISTLSTSQNYGLSLVLGGGEVRLFELTRAYGVLANGGKLVPSHPVLKIQDKLGNTIYTYDPQANTEETNNGFSISNIFNFTKSSTDANGIGFMEGTEIKNVIDEKYTYITTSILTDDRARSEAFGSGSALFLPDRTAAAKTGTTDNYRDSWTVGYTPSFVTGVWIGNNDNTPMLSVAGSIGAAPIWHNVMEYYLKGKQVEQFVMPSSVQQLEVCQDQALYGLLASCNNCQQKFSEVFTDDTAPTNQCTQTVTPSPGPTAQPTSQPTNSPTPAPSSTPIPATATPAPTATPVPATPTPIINITLGVTATPTPTP